MTCNYENDSLPEFSEGIAVTAPQVGKKVKVLYTDQLRYILQVEVTVASRPNEFTGRIEAIFAEGNGEITGGDVLKWKGQEMTFGNAAIVP